MGSNTGITVKVSSEELLHTAEQLKMNIRKAEASFYNVKETVNSVKSFWEGDGANEFTRVFNSRTSRINKAMHRFTEDVNNLEVMAGIYSETESTAVETIETLSSNVIE